MKERTNERKPGTTRVPLLPTPYVLNGDRLCWWLTKTRPKRDNPFGISESDSLGYYRMPGDCLESLPRRVLAEAEATELGELIEAVRSMERTMVEMKDLINEKVSKRND